MTRDAEYDPIIEQQLVKEMNERICIFPPADQGPSIYLLREKKTEGGVFYYDYWNGEEADDWRRIKPYPWFIAYHLRQVRLLCLRLLAHDRKVAHEIALRLPAEIVSVENLRDD